jgi:hypothetical protein
MAQKQVVNFDAEIEKLEEATDEWIGGSWGTSIFTHLRRVTKKIKASPEIRLAIYLKYTYGTRYSGETNEEWIEAAKEFKKILGGK